MFLSQISKLTFTAIPALFITSPILSSDEATVDTGNDSEGYNIDFVKMISFCETTQEYDQVCDIENRIRIGGGMDGLNITATDLIKIRDANHHPMLDNGLFEV